MSSKLIIVLVLVAICSIVQALNFNENIKIKGGGELYTSTNSESAYDDVASIGDDQDYSRELTTYGYGQSKLISSYIYKNNVSLMNKKYKGRYDAGLKMPDGIEHTISIKSNESIDSASTIVYENGDIVNGKTDFEINSTNGNFTESVVDYSLGHRNEIAKTTAKGDLTLSSKLDEKFITSCQGAVLDQLMEEIELSGIYPVKEIQAKYPEKIVIEGKEATGPALASYYLRDAAKYINIARSDSDKTNASKNFEIALNLAEKALEESPEEPNGWTIKGTALLSLDRIDDAATSYDKAIRLDKNNIVAIFGKAETLYLKGQYRQSLDYYNSGLSQSPYEADYILNKAQAQEKLGEYNDAIATVDQYIQLRGKEANAVLFKAYLQYLNGDFEGAKPNWEFGLGKSDQTGDIGIYYYYQGLTYEELKEWKEAIASFETAKKLDPTYAGDADIEIEFCDQKLNETETAPSANAGINMTSTNGQ